MDRLLRGVPPGSTVYVADEDLRVVHTNEEWSQFATDNNGAAVLGPGHDDHLLTNMSGATKARWAAVYKLLLERRLPHYEEDYICSSPRERRIYRLRITPTESDGATFLVHHTIRIDDDPDERLDMRRRVRALDSDPQQAETEYRRRVLDAALAAPGFRVARLLEPLDEIGGDMLWHRTHDDGTTDLVLADAMGHGTEAALHAAKLAMLFDSLSGTQRSPQDVLAAVNRGLIRYRPEHESAFATGIYFRVQRRQSHIRCANFGHMGPLFSRAGQVELGVGLPLGIVDTVPVWPETLLSFETHGTRMLAFSDGITEQFDVNGEMYGTDNLLRVFRAALELDLDTMLKRILDDVTDFRGAAIVKDDRTMICLEASSTEPGR
jgi:hypothetical protein